MTVAASTWDPDWDPNNTPMWRRYRERQIGEAVDRAFRQVRGAEPEPMWSPTWVSTSCPPSPPDGTRSLGRA